MSRERRAYVLYDLATGLFYTGDSDDGAYFTNDIERARQYPLPGRASEDISRLIAAVGWHDDQGPRVVCPEVRVRRLLVTYALD